MTGAWMRALGLEAQISLLRLNRLNALLGLMALLGLAAWLQAQQHAATDADSRQRALSQSGLQSTTEADRADPGTAVQQAFLRLQAKLGDRAQAQQHVRSLFAIAAANDLALDQGEYKESLLPGGLGYQYQIVLPVKAPYRSIRRFCDQVLLAMPFAALAEVSLKRETVSDETVGARLEFTLFLQDREPPNLSKASP